MEESIQLGGSCGAAVIEQPVEEREVVPVRSTKWRYRRAAGRIKALQLGDATPV
jgi:hypothetical protein